MQTKTGRSIPPSARFRRNLYWTDDMDEMIERAAVELKRRGVDNLRNSKGEPNRTAVIRHALQLLLKS